MQIYPNKIKNRIVFKITTGYKLELLSPETMKLLRSAKIYVDKNKDGQKVPKIESVIRKHLKYYLLLYLWIIWSVNYYFAQFINNAKNY